MITIYLNAEKTTKQVIKASEKFFENDRIKQEEISRQIASDLTGSYYGHIIVRN